MKPGPFRQLRSARQTLCSVLPLNKSVVKCWESNSIGSRGNVKEGLKLTPMSSFNVEQGGVNSRPGSHGVPEQVRTDGPGFSLCAAPLESSSPGFCGMGQRLGE